MEAEQPRKIRILIAEDHPIVRLGLKTLIEEEADMEIVATAADGQQAIDLHAAHRPDLVLMDLRMPGVSGVEAIQAIRAADPAARVLVLTTYKVDEEVFRAIQAGARGYVLKGEFEAALLEAIRSVHAGRRFIPAEIAARLAERMDVPSLSERETEVLELVAKGLTNSEIASAMLVTTDTVKTYLKRIYAKLDVTDRTEAAFVAADRGMLRGRT